MPALSQNRFQPSIVRVNQLNPIAKAFKLAGRDGQRFSVPVDGQEPRIGRAVQDGCRMAREAGGGVDEKTAPSRIQKLNRLLEQNGNVLRFPWRQNWRLSGLRRDSFLTRTSLTEEVLLQVSGALASKRARALLQARLGRVSLEGVKRGRKFPGGVPVEGIPTEDPDERT